MPTGRTTDRPEACICRRARHLHRDLKRSDAWPSKELNLSFPRSVSLVPVLHSQLFRSTHRAESFAACCIKRSLRRRRAFSATHRAPFGQSPPQFFVASMTRTRSTDLTAFFLLYQRLGLQLAEGRHTATRLHGTRAQRACQRNNTMTLKLRATDEHLICGLQVIRAYRKTRWSCARRDSSSAGPDSRSPVSLTSE